VRRSLVAGLPHEPDIRGDQPSAWLRDSRTWPATQVAKAMLNSGRLGQIHGYRGHFLHDHFADRVSGDSWRLDPRKAGSGVIGDIGSHALDLARYLLGDLAEISARSRSLLAGTVDDEADLHLEFTSGATGHVWLSWLASGTPMDIGFRVMGDRGALQFSWTRSNELAFYDATVPAGERGFRTIPLGPAHRPAAPYLPVAGIGMGYQTAFVTLLGLFLAGESATPSVADGLMISRYMQAALASAAEHGVAKNTL
jgi:predicted dehydrogenase